MLSYYQERHNLFLPSSSVIARNQDKTRSYYQHDTNLFHALRLDARPVFYFFVYNAALLLLYALVMIDIYTVLSRNWQFLADVGVIMQLYHHPLSLDSQKVRLVLEEKNIDYTSFHVNPITGKNFDSSFFRKNPNAKLPIFQNGSHILFDTIEIIQYIERIAMVSCGGEESSLSSGEVVEWIYKIQRWNPKLFTLSHVPPKYHLTVSKFLRRMIIARMAECPDLASAYHRKLKEAYDTEDKLKDPETLRRSKEHLERILDEADEKLSDTTYLLGEEFTLADVVFIPVLSRLVLLNLEDKYIATRPNLAEYWNLVKKRPSYRKVIGKNFDGWRRHYTLFKTWCFVRIRSLLKHY